MERVPEDVRLDLLLKGGYVIDPANEVEGNRDVGIRDGKIAEVSDRIAADRASHVIDVSGLLVTPGLVDIHVHAYDTRLDPGSGKFTSSLNADAHFLSDGVTTCVDTGTAGCEEIAHFRQSVMEKKICRILAFVNISAPGMGNSEQDIRTFDASGAASAAKEHRDVVVGIKTAHYWPRGPFDASHPPWASVDGAVEAGDLCGMPVMVDFWPRPPERSYPDLILAEAASRGYSHACIRPAVSRDRPERAGPGPHVRGQGPGCLVRPGPRRGEFSGTATASPPSRKDFRRIPSARTCIPEISTGPWSA